MATSRMEGTATPQNAASAQLAHRDALRVQVVDVHFFVFDALYLIILEHGQGALQRSHIGGFAAAHRPDDHEPVPHACVAP